MKLTTNKTQFSEALQTALAVAPGRATLPILDTIYLGASGSKLTVKSTDLDLHLSTSAPCEAEREGSICLPSKRLASLIRELPTESVSLEVENGIATISSGRLKTKLHGLPGDEFPDCESEDFTESVTIPGIDLALAIRRTAFCASTNESRYVLNGLLLAGGETPFIIGTDGKRLSKVAIDAEVSESVCSIIPNKAVSAIAKIIGEAPVSIELGESFATIHGENAVIRTRLISGNFPNWRQVMPSNLSQSLEIERETLFSAVRRVGLMANEKALSITLSFYEDQVTISAMSPDVGEASEAIETKCSVNGEVTVNVQFLLQALQNAGCETIKWSMDDETSPVLIESGNWQYVLMPMRKA